MGKMVENITARQMCELFGIEPDTLRIRFTKLHRSGNPEFPERWRIDGELTEKQVRELLNAGERKGSEPRAAQIQAEETKTEAAPPAADIAMIDDAGRSKEAAPNVVPKEPTDYALMFGAAVLLCIVLGHAALIWYDCSVLWATPGKIAGGIVFMLILAGVSLMGRERAKSVSDDLLWFVWLLDGLAIFVHYPTFWHSATIGYQFGIREFETWAMSGVVCVCSGAAVYFYRQIIKQ